MPGFNKNRISLLILGSVFFACGTAGAQITLVRSATGSSSSSTSVSATYSSTPAQGNLLVAIAGNRDASSSGPNTPSGWSIAISEPDNDPGQVIYYKIAGASEPTTVTVNGYSSSMRLTLHIYEYSGTAASSPLDQVSSASGNSSSPVSGSITPAYTNVLILAGIASQSDGSYSSWSSSFTEQNDFNVGNPANRLSAAGADRIISNSGTYSTGASTSQSRPWRGQIASFRKAYKTWDGGAGTNNWNDANNWNPNGVPSSSDDVELTGANTININTSAACNNLTLNNASLTVTIQSGQSLSVAGDLTLTNGTLNTQASFPTVTGTATTTGGTVGYTASSGSQTVASRTYNNLTISGGGTKTLAGNCTINGNLTVSGGTLDLSSFTGNRGSAGGTLTVSNGATLKIGGTNGFPSNYSSNTLGATSTVEYSGTSQTVANHSYGHLTLSGSGTKTMPGTSLSVAGNFSMSGTCSATAAAAVTVSGNFTIGNGTTFNGASYTHNIQGNFVRSGTFTASTCTMNFNGTTSQDISGTPSFNNLTIANTNAAVTSSSNISISTTFTVNANAIFSPSAASVISGSGTLTGSGTVRVTRTSATPDFLSQYTITNKTLTNLTVEYSSSGAQTISAVNYGNLAISGARTTNSVTLASSGTIGIAGSFSATATFTSGGYVTTGSTVDYNGAAQTVANIGYHNLTLSNTGVKTMPAASLTLGGSLTLSGSASAVAGGSLTINGDLNIYNTAGLNASSYTHYFKGGMWNDYQFTPSTSTVIFNGSSAQTITDPNWVYFNNITIDNPNGVSLSADLDVVGTLTLTSGTLAINSKIANLKGAVTATGGTLTSNASGTVQYNQGSDGQNVLAANYGNLTYSNFNKVFASAGTIGIAGTFTAGTATGHTITGSTIDYNGAGAQTVVNISYHHLRVSGGNTKTPAAGLSVSGSFTIGAATAFDAATYTHTIAGDFTNSGTFTAGTSTVQFTGGNDASITGATTFNVLTVNKNSSANAITLNHNVSTATLTMTQGRVSTGANAITVTSARTGDGVVIGTITRTHTFSASTAYAFEGPYQTLTFNSGGTLPTSVTVTTTLSSPGANDSMEPITRYYDISQTGGSGFTYTLRLHYEDSEVSSPNSETSPPLKLWRRTGTGPDVWTREGATSNNTTDNWVEQTGLTNTGRYSLSSRTIANMVLDLNANAANPSPGDIITYTIAFTNDGDGSSTNTLVTALAPANTTYVPASTRINGIVKTDAADADEVTVSGSTITVNLGTVGVSGSGTITYNVVIN